MTGGCCDGAGCGCTREAVPGQVSRRRFLGIAGGVATAALLSSRAEAAKALGVPEESLVLVPADKKLDPEWVKGLSARGTPSVWTGDELAYAGMPVGGGCAGQLYLGGDGRLWHWDVYNRRASGTNDLAYQDPAKPSSPFGQGFVLRTRSGGRTAVRTLDGDGFGDVRFTGQYPRGKVEYRDEGAPVRVSLEAWSPFVPLDVDSSTLPVTVLSYTLHNTSGRTVEADLLGWSENPVCLDSRGRQPIVLGSERFARGGARGVEFAASAGKVENPREDVLLEDWEKTTYDGWTVEGDAFGSGPVLLSDLPDYMLRFGDMHVEGERLVTSHRFEVGDAVKADTYTGSLTSKTFTLDRRYVTTRVGGGNFAGGTAVQVRVGGKVVGEFVGNDAEPLLANAVDVSRWAGEQAEIRIVDDQTGGWGHVNVDTLRLSDVPVDAKPMDELFDNGTFALAALDGDTVTRPSVKATGDPADLFDAAAGPRTVDGALGTVTGTVRVPVRLRPGQSRTVRFLVAWHFPRPDRDSLAFLTGAEKLERRYATRFGSARAVAGHVASRRPELERLTRTWLETWYDDSTLPHWFLERVMATAATFATSTCYQFQDGRFYGWEGVYCCAGTCEHVWNYAQAIGRLFPALERDTRERVDLGIGFHADTGQMGFRAEADMTWAADGQCGTILRIYREHLTSPDDAFLRRNWKRIKLAVQYVIGQDAGTDGTLEGPQPNTLDTVWYGEIAWITGMYVAALEAAAAMAGEAGDRAFAATCRRVAASGRAYLDTKLWNGEYYVQRVDPAHADVINSGRGCHVDQMFGQALATQLGLPRVFEEKKSRTALESLYRYNFTPDPLQYRDDHPEIQGGRIFAAAKEPALLMTTWPHGGEDTAAGDPPSWAAIYFNEAWTGQEYQAAGQMMDEGLVDQALIVTRAVHDRYGPAKRNPYNEIECGEHYARAMAGYGVYLAACGFSYHGPQGRLGFAPKIRPDDFRAAFTAAEGWGLYRQRRRGHGARAGLDATVDVRWGTVGVRTLTLAADGAPRGVRVELGRSRVPARATYADGTLTVQLGRRVTVRPGHALRVSVVG